MKLCQETKARVTRSPALIFDFIYARENTFTLEAVKLHLVSIMQSLMILHPIFNKNIGGEKKPSVVDEKE